MSRQQERPSCSNCIVTLTMKCTVVDDVKFDNTSLPGRTSTEEIVAELKRRAFCGSCYFTDDRRQPAELAFIAVSLHLSRMKKKWEKKRFLKDVLRLYGAIATERKCPVVVAGDVNFKVLNEDDDYLPLNWRYVAATDPLREENTMDGVWYYNPPLDGVRELHLVRGGIDNVQTTDANGQDTSGAHDLLNHPIITCSISFTEPRC